MTTVWIPPPLQDLTGGRGQVEARGRTVRELIEDLEARFPGLRQRLCEEDRLRKGLAVSIDGAVAPEGLRARLQEDSEVHFLPAIAGG